MSVGVEPDPGGIHTHQDGVIHIHPFQTATTGRNARLSDFFGQTGLEVTSNKIQLPDDPALGDNSGKTFENGDECPDGQEGVVKVLVWEDAAGTDDREGVHRRHRSRPVHQQRAWRSRSPSSRPTRT